MRPEAREWEPRRRPAPGRPARPASVLREERRSRRSTRRSRRPRRHRAGCPRRYRAFAPRGPPADSSERSWAVVVPSTSIPLGSCHGAEAYPPDCQCLRTPDGLTFLSEPSVILGPIPLPEVRRVHTSCWLAPGRHAAAPLVGCLGSHRPLPPRRVRHGCSSGRSAGGVVLPAIDPPFP